MTLATNNLNIWSLSKGYYLTGYNSIKKFADKTIRHKIHNIQHGFGEGGNGTSGVKPVLIHFRTSLSESLRNAKNNVKQPYIPEDFSKYVDVDKELPQDVFECLDGIKSIIGNYAKANNLYKIAFTKPLVSSCELSIINKSNLQVTVAKGKIVGDYRDVYKKILFEPQKENEVHPARQMYKQIVNLFDELMSGKYTDLTNEIK